MSLGILGFANMSHPSVHPVEDPVLTTNGGNDALPRIRMKDVQGMPGTPGGFILRSFQFIFAVASLCVMATTSDFPSVTAFRYLVATVSFLCVWSVCLGIVDLYALSVRRSLRNSRIMSIFTIGDGIACTMIFAAACSSAGITVLIGNDFNNCAMNHCAKFELATAMAFLSWFSIYPSFFLNFWSLASS